MRFLIFDSNVVYAKKVAQLLQTNVVDAEVEVAHNVPVLRRRLEAPYDLVIADVDTAMDSEGAAAELELASTRMPVVIWSVVSRGQPVGETHILKKCNATQILRKAFRTEDIQTALSEAVGATR